MAGGLNAYVYGPNPTGWVDPFGLAKKCPPCGGDGIDKLKPEGKYLKGKKHGVNWTEGPATAKSLKKSQGQWGSTADLDFAGEKASTLKPGEGRWFDLPEGHSSVVHRPDGTTVPANRIWVRNNGTGTFHGYPAE